MKFEFRAQKHYISLRYFDCVRLTKRSPRVLRFIASQGKKESTWKDVYDIKLYEPTSIERKDPGKYR